MLAEILSAIELAHVESLGRSKGMKYATFVFIRLAAKNFIGNDGLTSEKVKTKNCLQKGDL